MAAVSIHAPAWGATTQTTIDRLPNKFQSTRPRGARPAHARYLSIDLRFNPRARVGRDRDRSGKAAASYRVSIHAPAWGATF